MVTVPVRRAYLRDACLAAGVAVVALGGVLVAPPAHRPPDALAYGLVLLGALVLLVRRRLPVVAVLVTTLGALVYGLRGYPGLTATLPILVALFTAVRSGRRAIVFVPIGALVAVVLELAIVGGDSVREMVQNKSLLIGWLVAAAMMGQAFRQWSAYVKEVEQRAADVERSREETARRRAVEERLRIARELHDSLTHSISVIKMQAGVAVHLARKRGDEVPEALLAIQEASTDAVRELRATLGVLRRDDSANAPTDHSADSGPPAHDAGGARGASAVDTSPAAVVGVGAANNGEAGSSSDTDAANADADVYGVGDSGGGSGLDRLGQLVRQIQAAGQPATVTVLGHRRALPDEVDRAAYRIVQEALTNVGRHAGEATATVHLTYAAGLVTVQVDDDGRAAPADPPVPGMGLTGMRERVVALGGSLRAEPRAEGGFRVRAELPGAVVIRVLLVDDQPLIRTGMRALLGAEDDIEVVAEAADGRHGVQLASAHLPDVALVDVQMPVMDGIEATRRIAADPTLTTVRVVILTNFGLDEYVFDALRAGATGFILKDAEPADLIHAVRVAARGDALLSPTVTRTLISEFVARPPDEPTAPGLAVLTDREREVVALVARGLSNEQIAERMVVSPATAKTHVSRAMTKLHARDRAQLVVFAYESGLVSARGR